MACIGLQAVYLANVLGHWKRGLGFAALLTVLYGALYGLLVSENNALLMGFAAAVRDPGAGDVGDPPGRLVRAWRGPEVRSTP